MIVGRSAELARLDRLLDETTKGTSVRLVVIGDPGIGKSALLTACARRAAPRGLRVIRVRAVDGERGLPFALLDDLVRMIGATPGPRRGNAAQRSVDLLSVLASLIEVGPALVVVDEAQFSDAGSLEALAMATERCDQMPLAVVVAAEPTLGAVPRLAGWPRMEVGPLSVEASVAVLRTAVGPAIAAPGLTMLAEAIGGNPLALAHAPGCLSADELSGRVALPRVLPVAPALDRAWGSLLDRLPAGTRTALVDLAVVGRRPDLLAVLSAKSGWTDDDLDEAVRLGLVSRTEDGAAAFGNRVVVAVILGRAPAAAVREAHRLAAAAAVELALAPRIVVEHLVQSVTKPDADVAAALEREAERAERLDQLRMANDAWRASARLSTTSSDRVARAIRGIRLVIVNGLDYAGADELLDLFADQELDGESACWVEWLQALQRSEMDPGSALVAQWSTIRRARVAAPDTVRALLWDAAMNAWTLGHAEEGLRAAREYLELERRSAGAGGTIDPPWTGTALLAAGLFQSGDVAQSVRLRAEAMRASAVVDPTLVPFDRLVSIVFLDDLLLDAGAAAGDRLLVAAQRAGEGSAPLACVLGIHAWRARARGDFSLAREFLTRGRPIAAATGAIGAQLGMSALAAELAGIMGNDEALREEGQWLRGQATRLGDRRRLATLDRAVGLRALADGRPEVAVSSLAAAADVTFLGRGLRDGVLPARVDLVEVLVRLGDLTSAEVRQSELHQLLDAMGDPLATALDARSAALVSSGAEAERCFRLALDAHPADQDPFEGGRTLLLWGEHLRRARRRSEARSALLEAVRVFESLGAAPWLARAEGELRACGGQPDPTRAVGDLTAQERSVARAVAQGRTNREVAAALCLSPRTVEYHLGSVYRKLGVHGRSALARRMVEEDEGSTSS